MSENWMCELIERKSSKQNIEILSMYKSVDKKIVFIRVSIAIIFFVCVCVFCPNILFAFNQNEY